MYRIELCYSYGLTEVVDNVKYYQVKDGCLAMHHENGRIVFVPLHHRVIYFTVDKLD
jgi:hypothetical protein